MLGREGNLDDVDITMPGTHREISTVIQQYKQQHEDLFSFFETEKYGTMTIIPKEENSEQTIKKSLQYEITPFRTETTYSDGRHPDEVVRSNSLIEDSKRRDFTMNAMYYTRLSNDVIVSAREYNPSTEKELLKHLQDEGYFFDKRSQTLIIQNEELIQKIIDHNYNYSQLSQEDLPLPVVHLVLDPQRGIQDLLSRKIACVGTPDQRFQEDALRLVRGLRFAIALECDLHKTTRTSLKKNAYLIRQVAKERIKQELDKVFQ